LTGGRTFGKITLSLNVSTIATREPKEIAVADPTISLSVPGIATLPGEVAVGFTSSIRPGLSLKSRDADFYGSLSLGLSATKKLKPVVLGSAVRFSQRFQKYTFNRVGIVNSKHSESVSAFVAV